MTGLRRMPCRSVILDAEMCPPAPAASEHAVTGPG
jgi:hypothetical protein